MDHRAAANTACRPFAKLQVGHRGAAFRTRRAAKSMRTNIVMRTLTANILSFTSPRPPSEGATVLTKPGWMINVELTLAWALHRRDLMVAVTIEVQDFVSHGRCQGHHCGQTNEHHRAEIFYKRDWAGGVGYRS